MGQCRVACMTCKVAFNASVVGARLLQDMSVVRSQVSAREKAGCSLLGLLVTRLIL